MKQKTRQQRRQAAAPNQANESRLPSGKKPTSARARFSDHISELRRRIFFVALVFLTASALAYNFHDYFVELIMRPLGDGKLIYLTPGGGFNFIFQVSLYAGILIAAPMLMHQLYSFIKPALPSRARRSAVKVVSVSFLLMTAGVLFGYFIAVPSALHFLSTFAGNDITPNLTADSYLSFFLAYIAGLGVLFQLPLLLLFFHWIRPMTPGSLLKSERFIIVFIFIIAAIITPTPDIFNQMMIAGPLIVIYQFGVIAVLIAIKREKRKEMKTSLAQLPSSPIVEQMPKHQVIAPSPTLKAASASVVQLQKKPAPIPSVVAPVTVAKRRTLDGFGAAPPRAVRPEVRSRPPALQQRVPLPAVPPRRRLSVDGLSTVS